MPAAAAPVRPATKNRELLAWVDEIAALCVVRLPRLLRIFLKAREVLTEPEIAVDQKRRLRQSHPVRASIQCNTDGMTRGIAPLHWIVGSVEIPLA